MNNNDEQLNKLYKQFQNFTIDEHICDEDIASICTRWLQEYMIRHLAKMDN